MVSGSRKYRSNNNNLIIHIALFSYSFIALYNDNVKMQLKNINTSRRNES